MSDEVEVVEQNNNEETRLVLLLKRDFNKDVNSYSYDIGNETINESWFAKAEAITDNGIQLIYPEIGDEWDINLTENSSNSNSEEGEEDIPGKFICTNITLDNTEICNLVINGTTIQVVPITITWTRELYWKLPIRDSEEAGNFINWNTSFTSGGYKTYRVSSGAWYLTGGVPLLDENSFDFQVPILTMTLSAKIKGNSIPLKYNTYRNRVNKEAFEMENKFSFPVGSVLYDSFSATPFYDYDGSIYTYDLSMTFKILPYGYDWNYVWKNKQQATSPEDGQPLIWQNIYPNSNDYIIDSNMVGKPIYCGTVGAMGIVMGNPAYGVSGWDKVVIEDPNVAEIGDDSYIYPYIDLNDLIYEESQDDETPTNTPSDNPPETPIENEGE